MVRNMADKQKRQSRKRVQQEQNRIAKIFISLILIVFMIAMTAQIQSVYDKQQEYIAIEEERKQQYLDELERKEKLEDYNIFLSLFSEFS